MFGFFKSKPLLEDDAVEWIFDGFKWCIDNFGTDVFYNYTVLVTPSPKHFPNKIHNKIHNKSELAVKLFERVKALAGMEEWNCVLEEQDKDVDPVISPLLVLQNNVRDPAGTFCIKDEEITITYNPALIDTPEKLIATLAHELCHYLGVTATEPPPGGDEYWEPATDLLAVFTGFGVLLANSAFTFNQYTNYDTQGWSAEAQGYLSQYELIYALALFCELKSVSQDQVLPYIKSSLRSSFKKAVKEIAAKPEKVDMLRQIKNKPEVSPVVEDVAAEIIADIAQGLNQ